MRRGISQQRAFTLIEMAMAMAITAILLLTMSVCLVATVSAADTGADSTAAANSAGEKLGQMNAEMSVATSIARLGPTDILFTVPDRTGDGAADTIEYTWSGVAGGSVLRSFNGSTPTTFIPSVRSLDVGEVLRPPAVATESAEQVLAFCDSPTGATYTNDDVDDHNWDAEYVRPKLPPSAVSWKITRVRLYIKQKSGGSEAWSLRITSADSTLKPTTPILASTNIASNAVSTTAGWVEYAIGPVAGLSPSQGVCIEIDGVSGGKVTVQFAANGSNQPFNAHYLMTSNAGGAWSGVSDAKDLRFSLIGTYTTMVEP